MNIGVLTEGAFTPFDGFIDRLAILTNGAFSVFAVVEEEIIVTSPTPIYPVTSVKPVTIRRPLWVAERQVIPTMFIVWNKSHEDKPFWFEIWQRKYDYVDNLLKAYEKANIEVPLDFTAYDIYILSDISGEVDIRDLTSNGEIISDEDLGWMIINDQ